MYYLSSFLRRTMKKPTLRRSREKYTLLPQWACWHLKPSVNWRDPGHFWVNVENSQCDYSAHLKGMFVTVSGSFLLKTPQVLKMTSCMTSYVGICWLCDVVWCVFKLDIFWQDESDVALEDSLWEPDACWACHNLSHLCWLIWQNLIALIVSSSFLCCFSVKESGNNSQIRSKSLVSALSEMTDVQEGFVADTWRSSKVVVEPFLDHAMNIWIYPICGMMNKIVEGSLEVKLPTTWTDAKAEVGRVRDEKRRKEERRSKKRKSKKKEDAGARKGGKVAIHCVFPMFCGSGGSTSRLAKAAGAEPSGQMGDDKLHAVVARSTFRSQKEQNTPAPDHCWKLRCRKSAGMWTPLWREARFKAKSVTNWGSQTTFGSWDVEKVHAVVARSTFRSQTR